MTKEERLKAAEAYAKKCDPLNQTLEKQADIRQGFLAGAEAEAESKWISVKDILPENRSYILAYTTNGGYTSTCEYKHGCWFNGLDRLNFVTHWQPLPQKP